MAFQSPGFQTNAFQQAAAPPASTPTVPPVRGWTLARQLLPARTTAGVLRLRVPPARPRTTRR